MAPAVDAIRDSANLAVELANTYTELVLVDARSSEALDRGDAAGYEQALLAAKVIRERILRIEVEMAVVRSTAIANLVAA